MTPKHPAIYALTETGADTARRLHAAWPVSGLFLPERLCRPEDAATPFDSVASALAGNFRSFSGHLVFAACGIVVRIIAPLLRGKDLDPAVVVLDQNGRFAISLVSGHLGGANRLAQKAALVLGGTAVITTATDTAGLPSLDVTAQGLGYQLDNLPALAGVSRRILEQEKVGVWDPQGWLLGRMEKWRENFTRLLSAPSAEQLEQPLVWVGPEELPENSAWLGIRPPCLALGLGCNRGTSEAEISRLFDTVMNQNRLSRKCVALAASAGAKKDEAGLLDFARGLAVQIIFYNPEQLNQVEVPRPSEVVLRHMGTKSVCEAAAILASNRGRLIAPKAKAKNATMALALMEPRASSSS